MRDPDSDPKDSVTEVAEESFVRARPPDIERGTVLAGRYQVEEIIGKGGSGIVLRVFDRTAQNVVALKVLKTELAFDAKWNRRFSRELRLGRPIQHRNVCRIFDIGEADGHRFLTMELARGGSLRDELRRTRALQRPIADRLADVRAAIDGLAAIHATGVVHRDFKPDNLLRMEDGRLVISDFGLATDAANAPGATVLIGTPHYMAPEVLAGEPATSRSDVWALGVVMHEICFGSRPERRSVSFDGSGKGPLRPSSSVERAMLALCERCLADAPLDRPSDAGVLARQFEGVLSGRAGTRRGGRRLALAGAGAAALVALFGLRLTRTKGPLPPEPLATGSKAARLTPRGQAPDWSGRTALLANIPAHVDCFSPLGPRSARIVWGDPPRAEDIDLDSGRRLLSNLDPDSYQAGCPELSPSRRQLLYTRRNSAGASEIRLSTRSDGREARTITPGSEALWIDDDEFVYDVDQFHVALFSLPTMSLSILGKNESGKRYAILDKAVAGRGTLAVLWRDETLDYAIAVFRGRSFEEETLYPTPPVRRIQFVGQENMLVASYPLAGHLRILGSLDWQTGTLENVGAYPGFDIIAASLSDIQGKPGDALLVRHAANDLWYESGSRRQRVTTTGDVYSGDRSKSGNALLSRWNADGSINIWWQGRGGQLRPLTHGPNDVQPHFSPDERHWIYVDYVAKTVNACPFDEGPCQKWHENDMPGAPTFAPDGTHIAYLTQIGVPKVKILSADDGHLTASWDAYPQCPPVWSSSSRIWSFETVDGRHVWLERDIASGQRTGKVLQVKEEPAITGQMQCRPTESSPASPFFENVHVETNEVWKLVTFR